MERKRAHLHDCLDFDRIVSPEELSRSALECEKTVGWKRSVQSFMLTRMKNAIALSEELQSGTYRKKPANHFILFERGKRRVISAVHFRDRVVQRSYCDNFLIPLLCDSVVLDNSASQIGKGTEFARDRFELHLKRAWQRYGENGWFAHYDFRNYFASINPERAMELIERAALPLVENERDALDLERLLDLGRKFICEESGLGLGNQTSQTVALAFAGPIDHALNEVCRCGFAGRYMDDGYCFCPDKSAATMALGVAEEHARSLGLALHRQKSGMEPIVREHVFLKTIYSLRPDGSVNREVSRDTIRRYKRHYASIARLVARGELPPDVLDASEGSWKGVALRASDPAKYLREMEEFQRSVRGRLTPWAPEPRALAA